MCWQMNNQSSAFSNQYSAPIRAVRIPNCDIIRAMQTDFEFAKRASALCPANPADARGMSAGLPFPLSFEPVLA